MLNDHWPYDSIRLSFTWLTKAAHTFRMMKSLPMTFINSILLMLLSCDDVIREVWNGKRFLESTIIIQWLSTVNRKQPQKFSFECFFPILTKSNLFFCICATNLTCKENSSRVNLCVFMHNNHLEMPNGVEWIFFLLS